MDSIEQFVPVVARLGAPLLIAVDGVDGAGKTTFATRLAMSLEAAGRGATVIHEDDFLAPRQQRYRLGSDSPEGFFSDSYNLEALRHHVLDPLVGDRWIKRRHFDHRTDRVLEGRTEQIPHDTVVIVEGLLLHRDELVDRWDWSIFLDVPFSETARRMAERNGSDPDPEHPSMRRFVEGQRIYLDTCRPHSRASVVLAN